MRRVVMIAAALVLAGCAKERIAPWHGSAPRMAAHSGPVCLLPGKPPEGVEYTLLGKVAASHQWYGGFAGVHAGLARVARSWGADAVIELVSRQRFGFFAYAHPDAYGFAVKIKNPEDFNCVASGGKIDPGVGSGPVAPAAATPRPTSTGAAPGAEYDQCIARVMKVRDEKLRLEAMEMCDSAGK